MSRRQKPSSPAKGGKTTPRAERRSRARDLAQLNEAAAWLLRDSRRLLRKHGKRLDETTRAAISELRNSLVGACEPKPKQRDEAELLAAVDALDEALTRHLGRHRKSPLREYVEAIGWAVILALLIRAFVFEAFKIPTGSMIPTLHVHDHLFVNKFIYGFKIPFTRIKFLEFREPLPGEIIVFEYPYTDDPDSTGKDLIKRVIATPGDRVQLLNNHLQINGQPIARAPSGKSLDCGEAVEFIRQCQGDSWCLHPPQLDGEANQDQVLARFDTRLAALQHLHDLNGYVCQQMTECIAGQRWTAQYRLADSAEELMLWSGPLNDANWPPRQFDERRYSSHARSYAPPLNEDWPVFIVPKDRLLVMGDNRDNSKDGRFFGLVPLDTIKGKAGFIWYAYERHWWWPDFSRIGTFVHDDGDGGSCP